MRAPRARAALAAFTALSILALAPSAGATTYEQTGVFAGSATPLTKEQLEANEEIQLGGVSSMAVNRTGAGGVPRGTLYALTKGGEYPRVAMYVPKGQGLAFSLAWEARSIAGPYERCGPALGIKEGKAEHPCKALLENTTDALGIDVDQSTGYVYVFDGRRSRVSVFDAEGSAVITRFGERAAVDKKVAETPSLFHASSGTGGIAVNDVGEAFVFDLNDSPAAKDNFYHRLMVFRPKTPGDYSEYEYAGEIAAGFIGENEYPTKPVLDEAGHLYTATQGSVEELPAQSPEPYPAAHPAPLCGFDFAKESLVAMTIDPRTGEPFFTSYKKEKGFTHKVLYQLGPCEAGKFKEPAKLEILPERDDLTALAFDPFRKLEAARPTGALYGGAPSPVPSNAGTGEPGQSALGYLFAQPKGAVKALSVSKSGSGSGTVTSEPEGISCGVTCSAEFAEGETVTLTAKAAVGSSFAGWSGACSGTGSCKVTMSEAKSVTASFEEGGGGPVFHTLKVTVSGEGEVSADSGTISGCTSSGGASCEGQYEEGAKVTLTETPTPGNLFTGWETPQCDESTATTCAVTIGSADEAVAASFEAEPEEEGIPLTVSVEGPGTVTSDKGLISCSPFCSDEYAEGTKVTLTASPNEGSLFMAWKHCDSGGVNGRQCTVTMSKAKEVSAVFATAHALTLTKADGSGPGKLTASGGISCPYACEHASSLLKEGTAVTITQTPARHFHFAGWEGDCSGTGSCEVSMGEDHEVKALWEADPKLSLALTKTGGGQALIKSKPAGLLCGFICLDAGASFYEGEAITLSWKLNKGTTKLTWSKGAGTCTGSSEAPEGSCTLNMSAATELEATLQ
ncbi:MAG TPA: hypothetical protein VF245_08610 [Solirubrobacterales bacterium]